MSSNYVPNATKPTFYRNTSHHQSLGHLPQTPHMQKSLKSKWNRAGTAPDFRQITALSKQNESLADEISFLRKNQQLTEQSLQHILKE